MNFMQRAWCSVVRRKGKSLILFVVIFILGNVIAGSIAIQQSTENVEKKIKADLGALATVEYDYEKINKMENDGEEIEWSEPLTEKQIKEIGTSPYVKEFDYSVASHITVDKLKTVTFDSEDSEATMHGGMSSYLLLTGSNAKEPLNFKNKEAVLIEGRSFEEKDLESSDYVGIVSNKLAEENSLSLGDELMIDSQFEDYKEDGSSDKKKLEDFSIKIIGIFEVTKLETKTSEDQKDNQNGIVDPYFETEKLNTIYMPNKAVQEIDRSTSMAIKKIKPEWYVDEDGNEIDLESEENFYATPTYILKSPEDVDAFKEETTPLIPDLMKVLASTDKYDEVGGSMKKLSQISGYVVIIAVIATLIIISLVVVLFLRDRKHELGIYLSLGEKRRNVLLQIVLELLVISIVAMCLSLITGNLLGGLVSDSLLQSDILTSNTSSADYFGYNSLAQNISLSAIDIQEAYQVEFSIGYIVTFLIFGLLTILGAAILPLLYILRLNPKKIMM